MIRSCICCGRNNQEDSDLVFFDLPSRTEYPDWHDGIIKHLGFDDKDNFDEDSENIQICEKHFKSDDIETEGNTVRLKENALPSFDDEDAGEFYVKPELVYLNSENTVDYEEESENQNLTPVQPLIVYQDQESEDYEYDVQGNIETEVIENDTDSQKIVFGSEEQVFNVVSSEGHYVQPMMPFYLSDSPVFTIMNENNEVGETIILQIEDSESQQEETSPNPKVIEAKPARDDLKIATMELQLCRGGDIVIDNYCCDICNYSYGCMNCLKSHYETMHVTNSNVVHYKCKYTQNYPKGLVCPVCHLMFETRSETMDHYITHSVACDICFSGFDRQLYLTEHMLTVHNKADPEIIYECDICKNEYHNSPALSKHYQGFHKMILCYICKMRFETVGQLQSHEKVHWQKLNVLPYACSKCNKAFAEISEIAVHLRQEHKKTVSDINRTYVTTQQDIMQMPRKRVKVKK